MRAHNSPNQLMFDGFETEFEKWLDPNNRWVVLSRLIPWAALSAAYNMSLSGHAGRPAKDAQLVIGAVIIKHKLCLSDEETIEQIRVNPYLQSFVGFKVFHKEQAFAPSLFVEIRRRMGPEVSPGLRTVSLLRYRLGRNLEHPQNCPLRMIIPGRREETKQH